MGIRRWIVCGGALGKQIYFAFFFLRFSCLDDSKTNKIWLIFSRKASEQNQKQPNIAGRPSYSRQFYNCCQQ